MQLHDAAVERPQRRIEEGVFRTELTAEQVAFVSATGVTARAGLVATADLQEYRTAGANRIGPNKHDVVHAVFAARR